MKSTILFTTEAQRAQSNDPSAPPTALASPACGWSRVSEGNPSVVGLSMLQSFRLFFGCSVSVLRSLGLAGCFVVSLLVLIPALHAQTNTFPSSGNVGIGTTSPLAKFQTHVGTDQNLAIDVGATGVRLDAFNDAGNANVPLEIQGTNIKLVTNSGNILVPYGNVGVGTTSPQWPLHVLSNGETRILNQVNSGGLWYWGTSWSGGFVPYGMYFANGTNVGDIKLAITNNGY